ncbi:MAG TPA: Txe/YoeB family addiction module toxin [Longimicrobiales bacterium]|nr:Txe/YoeB family addiction module toxin [Longimicrobiales bacterium]
MARRRESPKRIIHMQPEALEDLRHWVQHDRKLASKALDLVEAARRDPFTGIGKPDPLKNLGPDVWSRRITQEDRLVYRVADGYIGVLQARYHY